MTHIRVPSVGFILWWRAAPRKKNAFFYFAMGTWLAPYVIAMIFVLATASLRLWAPFLVLASFVTDLYMVRGRLPRWAWPFPIRTRVFVVDEEARPVAGPPVPLVPRDPLTDPYDAVSFTGAHRPPPDTSAEEALHLHVEPPPTAARLRRATRRALKVARRDLRTGERVRLTGDASAGRVRLRLTIVGPGADAERARSLSDELLAALRRALPGATIARES